jgi:hypothetical protein
MILGRVFRGEDSLSLCRQESGGWDVLPSMASFGVLNPRPTDLYHLLPPFPATLAAFLETFSYLQGEKEERV